MQGREAGKVALQDTQFERWWLVNKRKKVAWHKRLKGMRKKEAKKQAGGA